MPGFVRVTNNDTIPFTYHSDNVKKRIPPGQDAAMPWALACSLFGDPFLRDEPKKPDRTIALALARGNFNYELGMETIEHFMARLPNLSIHDMETGQPIHMLLFDPDGEHTDDFIAPDADATDSVTLLQQQLAMVQQQLSQLLAAQQQFPPEVTGQTTVVSTDAPAAPESAKVTEWVNGDPFAQRPEDAATAPLFDFAAIASSNIDPHGDDSVPDPNNDILEDSPQDAGVGSARGRSKLAPKR